MRKREIILILCFWGAFISLSAQEEKPDTTYWKKQGSTSLTFGQTSFTNWSAGGENSVSILGAFAYKADYKKDKIAWNNTLDLGYGLSYQGSDQIKNDDHINFSTNFGWQASKLWYYAAELSFKSQFDKGYSSYPVEKSQKNSYISKFMSPGYVIGSIGMSYAHPKEDLKIFISPMSEKMTFVTDERLSNDGAYGVKPGEKIFAEFGALAKGTYTKKFNENILFGTVLSLTSAYETIGNIDVDWTMSLDWKLNKYFTFKANTYLLYDDDIKFIDKAGNKKGARIQFKEVIGFGIGYIF
jgi:Protein of unknown function (DUF3078).